MSTQGAKNAFWQTLPTHQWIGFWVYVAIITSFIGFYPGFTGGAYSAATWLEASWNWQTDYEHGWMVPLLCIYMLVHACGKLKGCTFRGSMHGIWLIVLGCLLFLVAVRTQQGRIAIGGVPFLLTGAVWYYWGGRAAWVSAFPCFFLWMSIPLPGFQQATVGMQIMATQAAHWFAGLCGVQTIMEGTNITSASGAFETYSIAGGCSGMRSLMALLMISTAWGYLADKLSLWKRITLGLSAIPISIIANAFRVASIFICAEYINPAFASKTWHDWSGLLFFFPASLMGLMLLHGLLAGEVPFLHRRRTVVRRSAQSSNDTPSPQA